MIRSGSAKRRRSVTKVERQFSGMDSAETRAPVVEIVPCQLRRIGQCKARADSLNRSSTRKPQTTPQRSRNQSQARSKSFAARISRLDPQSAIETAPRTSKVRASMPSRAFVPSDQTRSFPNRSQQIPPARTPPPAHAESANSSSTTRTRAIQKTKSKCVPAQTDPRATKRCESRRFKPRDE